MDDTDRAHVWHLRKSRVSLPHQAYYITKCVLPIHGGALSVDGCAKSLIDTFLWAQENEWWHILGFVVMPGHYHVALGLGAVKTLSQVMQSVDRYTSRQMNGLLGRKGQLWEEGFHDHAIRDRDDFDGILIYMHDNPVRAELVDSAESWPFSTANPVYASAIDREWLGHSMPR